MITGINHITLSVSDLDRALTFYTQVLCFGLATKTERSAYVGAGSLWLALVVDKDVRAGPLPEYTHIAFDVTAEEFNASAERIRASGAIIFKDNVSEGQSLYFLDPDGHKLELHVGTLESRLASMTESQHACHQ